MAGNDLDSLCPTNELPSPYDGLFPWPFFNKMQSKMIDRVWRGSSNFAVAAPTGSGKTVLFELAILRGILSQVQSGGTTLSERVPGESKAVYLAPSKALCDEKARDWQEKFSTIGVTVKAVTGDTVDFRISQLHQVDIIVSTPEKWDSISRWASYKSVVANVDLLLVDEIHTICSDRGHTLEAVVARMMTMSIDKHRFGSFAISRLRIAAVSATVPNISDIGQWIGAGSEGTVTFGDEFRPTRLETVVLGFPASKNEFLFELANHGTIRCESQNGLMFKLMGIVQKYSKGKPVLVFGSTRKGIIKTAKHIVENSMDLQGHSYFVPDQRQREKLNTKALQFHDGDLRSLVPFGVAFHSAGLQAPDRRLVESLFEQQLLKCVCTTSTLATGVNLPAHLVILQGTSTYKQGQGYVDLSNLEIVQIAGRAGRPQYDDSGVCVILTNSNKVNKYQKLATGCEIVESRLHEKHFEVVNAEVVLETITDVSVALQWIKCTFLYIRLQKNPTQYGLKHSAGAKEAEKYLEDLLLNCLNELTAEKVLKTDEYGFTFEPTKIAKSMAQYCVLFKTVKLFKRLEEGDSLEEMLNILSAASEFAEGFVLRRDEKKALNEMNKQHTKFRIKGRIQQTWQKISCMIQFELGLGKTTDILEKSRFALSQQINQVLRDAGRILRCLHDYAVESGNPRAILNVHLLRRAFDTRLWHDSPHVTRQFSGVGKDMSARLTKAGATSLDALKKMTAWQIESACSRKPPFGQELLREVETVPDLTIQDTSVLRAGGGSGECCMAVTLENASERSLVATKSHKYLLLVSCMDTKQTLGMKTVDHRQVGTQSTLTDLKFSPKGRTIRIDLISTTMTGLDKMLELQNPLGKAAGVQPTVKKAKTVSKLARQIDESDDFPNLSLCSDTDDEDDGNTGKRKQEDQGTVCLHKCKDKSTCAHECCKTGLSKRRRRRKEPASHQGSSGIMQPQLPHHSHELARVFGQRSPYAQFPLQSSGVTSPSKSETGPIPSTPGSDQPAPKKPRPVASSQTLYALSRGATSMPVRRPQATPSPYSVKPVKSLTIAARPTEANKHIPSSSVKKVRQKPTPALLGQTAQKKAASSTSTVHDLFSGLL